MPIKIPTLAAIPIFPSKPGSKVFLKNDFYIFQYLYRVLMVSYRTKAVLVNRVTGTTKFLDNETPTPL